MLRLPLKIFAFAPDANYQKLQAHSRRAGSIEAWTAPGVESRIATFRVLKEFMIFQQ